MRATMKLIIKTAYILLGLLSAVYLQAQEHSQDLELLSDNAELESPFERRLENLNTRSFNKKAEAVSALSKVNDTRVLLTLKEMLAGNLYYRKSDKEIVFAQKVDDGLQLISVLRGENLGVVGKRDAKKITINNKLRKTLRAEIAVLELGAEDVALRLTSARNLIKTPNPELMGILLQAEQVEVHQTVKHLLGISIALINVESEDQSQRLQAVEVLGAAVEPEVVAVLRALAEKNADGSYIDKDLKVAELAEDKLSAIDSKLFYYQSTENLFFGLSLGSVFLLAAIGLAITFGVMGVINMAHGEMLMIGAYTTFAVQQIFPGLIEWSLFIAIPAAFLVSGLVGALIERLIIRHLYGRPLDTLLATFGVGLILQQLARSYNSNNVPVKTPEWMSGAWAANGAISFNFNRIYILIFSLVVLFMLTLLLKKTLFGLQMRAVTQNRAMASSMGIKQNWVDALTFGLGSGIAGIGGVALSQITNVGPNLGTIYIIDSFMVVVFGGVGSLIGTFFGSMGLGILNKLLEPSVGAVVGKIIVLVFIILFIQWRPRGLFALKGRSVEE